MCSPIWQVVFQLISFAVQKLFNLLYFYLCTFTLFHVLSVSYEKNHSKTTVKDIFPIFFLGVLQLQVLHLRLIYFNLIFMSGMKYEPHFTFLHMAIRNQFTSSYPIWMHSPPPCLITLAGTFSTMLNRSGIWFFILGNTFSFSTLRMILAASLSYSHTSKISPALFQTTAVKQISEKSESHKIFASPVHIKVTFILYCSMLCAIALCF